MAENVVSILKKINSVSFISVTSDDGRTLLFIPAWAVAAGIILLVVLLRARRGKEESDA
jgi:hypothetical protein